MIFSCESYFISLPNTYRDRAVSFAHAWSTGLLENTAAENCRLLHDLCFSGPSPDYRTLKSVLYVAQLGIKHIKKIRPLLAANADNRTAHTAVSVNEDIADIKNKIYLEAHQHTDEGTNIQKLLMIKKAVQDKFEVESFSDLGEGDFVDFVARHCPDLLGSVKASAKHTCGYEGKILSTSDGVGGSVPMLASNRLSDIISGRACALDPKNPIATLYQVEQSVVASERDGSSFESLGHGSFLSFVVQRPQLVSKFYSGDRLLDVLDHGIDKDVLLDLLYETARRSTDESAVQTNFKAAVQLQYGIQGVEDLVDKFMCNNPLPDIDEKFNGTNDRMLCTEASFSQLRSKSACSSKTTEDAIRAISTCTPLESVEDETQARMGV